MKLYKDLQNPYSSGVQRKAGHLWLADRAAQTPKGHWLIRHPDTGHWTTYSSHRAANTAMNQFWQGGPQCVTANDIKEFMGDDKTLATQAPTVAGEMSVPSSDAVAVEFDGKVFINSWLNTIVAPNEIAARSPELQPVYTLFFRMLRESLCGRSGVKSLEQMLDIARGDDAKELEFRFVMNWLSAPLQRVGFNLQTNLWLLGDLGGTGKGTLYTLLGKIYGAGQTAKVEAGELDRNWNDVIKNKLLVCINEINTNVRFDWNAFINKTTTETVVEIMKRRDDSVSVINFANYVFLSNREAPSCLNRDDRRNFLCATTYDHETARLAQKMQDWMHGRGEDDKEMHNFIGGLVYFFRQHKVDWDMLKFAPPTAIKLEAQESMSRDSELYYWLCNDVKYPRNEWLYANDYTKYYRMFTGGKKAEDMTPVRMGLLLSQLARKGIIRGHKKGDNNVPKAYMIPIEKFPVEDLTSYASSGVAD